MSRRPQLPVPHDPMAPSRVLRPGRFPKGWWRHGRAAFAGAGAAALLLTAAATVRAFTIRCPEEEPCVTVAELAAGEALPEAIEVLDREGRTLAEVAGPLRRSLTPEEIPPLVRDAFIAVEDRRFHDHEGIDVRGVIRAATRNILAGGVEEGASTIPMQLVRTLWSEPLRDAGPWRRKMVEALTAPRLVERLGHERVLTLYLNSIYMGNGLYGIERAAAHYFGRSVSELDLAEVATLVGMTQGPERFEPRRHPERARIRRNVVLRILATEGVVAAEEARRASEKPMETIPEPEIRRTRSYLTAAVTRELRAVAPDLAARPGLRVYTGVDPVVQRAGERSLARQLDLIEKGTYGVYAPPDSATVLQGAAVALDPETGAVRAWIGGRDFRTSEFDRVDQAFRQVGSLVKPFLVASAVERGISILAPVSADTVPIASANGPWMPADHVPEMVLPLREALIRSSNRAAAHLGVALGLDAIRTVGRDAGIQSAIPALPSTSIGAFDASLLEMTGAYAIFGNGGQAVESYLIERIEARDGTELWRRPDGLPYEDRRVLDRRTSFVVLDAMRDVVDHGTAYSVRATGYTGPAAGKTGTTNEGRDAWFVGLTPGLASGIWVGFDRPETVVRNAGGGALAAPAWARWMREAGSAATSQGRMWLPPVGVERVRYDPVTGQAVGRGCPVLSGVEPREAWVRSADLEVSECRRGVLGWLQRAWRTISPPDVEPLAPVRIPGSGGR